MLRRRRPCNDIDCRWCHAPATWLDVALILGCAVAVVLGCLLATACTLHVDVEVRQPARCGTSPTVTGGERATPDADSATCATADGKTLVYVWSSADLGLFAELNRNSTTGSGTSKVDFVYMHEDFTTAR